MTENQKLGNEMYRSCREKAQQILTDYNDVVNKAIFPLLKSEDVNNEEIVISFMWQLFDLINTRPDFRAKYEKTTHYFFSAYLQDCHLEKNEDKDQEMNRIGKRFDEYLKIFRQGETKLNISSVSMRMSENILNDVNTFFQTSLAVGLQAFIIMWGDILQGDWHLEEGTVTADFQEKLIKASALKKEGNYIEALKLYNDLHDILIDEASKQAKLIPETIVEEGGTRKIMPSFLLESEKFLRKNNHFCRILNNMGVIYAEIGDIVSAQRCFQDSIKFTPENTDYQDPKIGLKELEELYELDSKSSSRQNPPKTQIRQNITR